MSHTLLAVTDAVERVILTACLGAAGHTIDAVDDGLALLDEVDVQRPDAVLIDEIMPRASGQEVCRALREREANPVVVLLAARTQSPQWTAMRWADLVVEKPLDPDEVLEQLAYRLEVAKR